MGEGYVIITVIFLRVLAVADQQGRLLKRRLFKITPVVPIRHSKSLQSDNNEESEEKLLT